MTEDDRLRHLEKRRGDGLLRTLSPLAERYPGSAVRGGTAFADFSSNDYLGLSRHPDVVKAAAEALSRHGVGAGASRLMTGDYELHHALEEAVAAFKGKEAALVFNSGYQANVGILSALAGRGDAVFADRLSHASLLDGAALSRAALFRFRHNDPEHLDALLARHRGAAGDAVVVTESVFSMDGDRAPLRELVAVARRHGASVLVDEAHATGVFGRNGGGLAVEEGVAEGIDFVMGTFSKALGGFGAYLAASRVTVDYLVNASRGFVYSTALPPAVVAADLAAVEVCGREETRRRAGELLRNADGFREALRNAGLDARGESQIVPVIVGESGEASRLSGALAEAGILVLPVRPPTVPEGSARLRFSLCAAHGEDTLRRAAEALRGLR